MSSNFMIWEANFVCAFGGSTYWVPLAVTRVLLVLVYNLCLEVLFYINFLLLKEIETLKRNFTYIET